MANLFVTRGDLNQAMKLYQQALAITEMLGDLQGKGTTLAMIGQLFITLREFPLAVKTLLDSLQILSTINAHPIVEKIKVILVDIQKIIGDDEFENAWKQSTESPIPDWLSQSVQEKQGATIEQFIAGAIQSAREKRPEAEQYFKQAQKIAIDSDAPAELQSLGVVLQRIMIGEKNVDLSALTSELREIVEKTLER